MSPLPSWAEPMPGGRRSHQREHVRVERSAAINQSTRTPQRWTWVRLGVGALVLGVVVWRLGAGPFVDGLRMTSLRTLLVATAITAVTTLCCAWRWRLVAARLGVPLDLAAAVTAVYRSQFLNATLPGGIIGDVDRAAGHARTTGSVSGGIRSVVWERTLGQVVQISLSLALLLVLPSPMRPVAWVAALGLVAAGLVLPLVFAAVSGPGFAARLLRSAAGDLAAILRPRAGRLTLVLTSAGAHAGHLAVFVIAARVAGVTTPLPHLLPIAVVVLLAASLPTNIAGWGPREGVAAWAFAAAGLGAAAGLTTAVVFGVMALVATLPGAVVLLVGRGTTTAATRPDRGAVLEEAVHG